MQQINNAFSVLPVATESNAVDPGSLGPALGHGGAKSAGNSGNEGFGRVLREQHSQAGSTERERSEAADAQGEDDSRQVDASARQGTEHKPGDESGRGLKSADQGESGKIMPQSEADLPPVSSADGRELEQIATELAELTEGEEPAPVTKPVGHAIRDQLVPSAAKVGVEKSAEAEAKGRAEASENSQARSKAEAEALIAGRALTGDSEADSESRAIGAEAAKARNTATQEEAATRLVSASEEADVSDRLARKVAAQDRAEFAPGRPTGAAEEPELQAPRQTAQVTVAVPAADAALTNAARQGAVLQAGLEPPFGARIAVGQDGWNQLVAQRIANLAARGSNGAEIQLDPPDLGPIKVTIQMLSDQQVSVTVQSHSQAVRDALEQSAHRLRDLFNQSGLDLSSLDVSDHSLPHGRGEEQSEQGQASASAATPSGQDEQTAASELPLSVALPVHPGRIDFYI